MSSVVDNGLQNDTATILEAASQADEEEPREEVKRAYLDLDSVCLRLGKTSSS